VLETTTQNNWFSHCLIGLTIFDESAKILLDGRDASEFQNDNEAEDMFCQNIQLHTFDVSIVGERRVISILV